MVDEPAGGARRDQARDAPTSPPSRTPRRWAEREASYAAPGRSSRPPERRAAARVKPGAEGIGSNNGRVGKSTSPNVGAGAPMGAESCGQVAELTARRLRRRPARGGHRLVTTATSAAFLSGSLRSRCRSRNPLVVGSTPPKRRWLALPPLRSARPSTRTSNPQVAGLTPKGSGGQPATSTAAWSHRRSVGGCGVTAVPDDGEPRSPAKSYRSRPGTSACAGRIGVSGTRATWSSPLAGRTVMASRDNPLVGSIRENRFENVQVDQGVQTVPTRGRTLAL